MTTRRTLSMAAAAGAYIGAIVAANYLTARYGMVAVLPGLTVTAGTYAAGLALLARDVLQGDQRIGRPGHKDRAGGESQFASGSVRVTVAEAAVLQSFPVGYPWQGSASKQYMQVGNAVPPLLAARVLSAVGTVLCMEVAA